jgi:exosortase A-associated hydrolase 1
MTQLRKYMSWACEDAQITGILHQSSKLETTGIVIIPGGTQTRTGAHRLFVTIADALARAGYPTLRFDPRGRGDSSGLYPGFEHLEPDITAAIQALRQAQPRLKQVVLLGHCDGAAAAAFATSQRPLAAGLILLNPWARTDETRRHAQAHQDGNPLSSSNKWKRLFTGKVNIGRAIAARLTAVRPSPRLVIPATGLLADWASAWERLSAPVLVITGSWDASGQEFMSLLSALPARQNLSIASISNGDHSFSDPSQTEELIYLIINYLQKNIDVLT